MSTVSAVSSVFDPTATNTTSSSTVGQQTLGQDDFLKLLAQQFESQDPMQPMQDTSFIAQMAQFTSLQQSSAMSKDMSDMKSQQQVATANSYLGHRVTVDAGNGQSASGDVTAVQMVDGVPQLVVGGNNYDMSAVLVVEPSAVTAPASSTTSTP